MNARRLVIYEDRDAARLAPLTDTVVVPALVFGAGTLASRWVAAAGLPLLAIEARHAVLAAATGLPAAEGATAPADELVVANAAALPGPWFDAVLGGRGPALFLVRGRAVAARVPFELLRPGLGRGEDFETVLLSLGLPAHEVDAVRIERPWQLFERNADAVTSDLAGRGPGAGGTVHRLAALEQPDAITVEAGAEVGPYAVLDAREGPILVGAGARIAAHTVVTGPCVIGAGTQLLGGFVSRSTFGPECRIAGEVEECVWQGFANKRHHGFVGHSWIGEWANLGALTTTSDLKNNYGEVRVRMAGREVATGSRKVGSLLGAHVKTGIGSLLTTGSVIGTGSNLFGGGRFAPRELAPFSWWDGATIVTHELEKFLATARIAFSRRGRTFGPADETLLRACFVESAHRRESGSAS